MTDRPLITLRRPDKGDYELVIAKNGKIDITKLTLDQITLLLYQASRIIQQMQVKERE